MQNVLNYKNMENSKKHFTKKEIEARKKASESFRTKELRKTAPAWLQNEAKKEWRKIIDDVKGYDLFTSADENLLGVYCEELVKYKNSLKNSNIGSDRILKQLIVLSEKLGLTPSSRAKLAVKKASEEIKQKEEFDI